MAHVPTTDEICCTGPLARPEPTSMEVDWTWLLVICVPGIIGMLWFSWRLHQSINRCKIPEESLVPTASRRASIHDDKLD